MRRGADRRLRPRRGRRADRHQADRSPTTSARHSRARGVLPQVRGQETVMSLLMRNATVTHPLRRRLRAEHRRALRRRSGWAAGRLVLLRQRRQAPKGAAATNVHPGDHIWWDRHDWSQTDSVPAVVGSFPEPFLNGIDGKRLPVRVECAAVAADPCRTVSARLRALGVPAPSRRSGSGDEPETLRVLVGPWTAVSGDPARSRSSAGRARAASTRASPPTGDAHAARPRQGARPARSPPARG